MSEAPVERKSNSAVGAFVRHPLFLLLAGTLLGSVLIPYLNNQAVHAKESEELRNQRTLAALQANNDVDRRLNVLITTFGAFWTADEASRKSRRPELRAKIYQLYEEFDRTAWWWFDESWQGAEILGLLKNKEVHVARELSQEYKNSLLECTKAVDLVWHMSLAQDPPPSLADAEVAIKRARTTLSNSRTERLQIMAKFAKMLQKRS